MDRRALAIAVAITIPYAALLAWSVWPSSDRVLVCVSGWAAEDDGHRLRLVRRDGNLVACK